MKNTTTITPLGARQLANNESASAGESVYMKNLREREGALEAVGSFPALDTLDDGETLLCTHIYDHSTYFITVWRNAIRLRGRLTDGIYTSIGTGITLATSTPTHATCIGSWVVVNTEDGSLYLRNEGYSYRCIDPQNVRPTILLHSTEAIAESRQISAITFGTAYTSWTSLTDTDLTKVSTAVRSALKNLVSSAQSLGKFTGAVWARCGVRLIDDTYLWLSAPVLVGYEEAQQCCQGISASVTQSSSAITGLSAFSPQLTAYRLGITPIRCFSSDYDSLVKAVDILITDEVPFYDSSADVDYRCARSTTGTLTYSLVVNAATIHGETAVTARLAQCSWHIASSTTDFDSLRDNRWVANNCPSSSEPILSGHTTAALSFSDISDVSAQVAKCLATVGADVTCRHAISNGNRLFRGGIDLIHRMPWSAACYFTKSVSDASCRVSTEITVGTIDGDATISRYETLPFTPAAVSPAIFVPLARAKRIAITVSDSAGTVTWQSALMPLTGCEAAGAVAKGFAEGTLSSTTADISTATLNYREQRRGSILITNDANPFGGEIIEALSSDEIEALAIARKPMASNSFGKYPIYVFGGCGTYALPQSLNGTYGEVRRLSRAIIRDDTRPCEAGDDIYFISSDKHLMSLRGAVITRRLRTCNAVQMAWNACEDELWMLDGDGNVSVLMASHRQYVRSETLSTLLPCGVNATATTTTNDLLLIAHEVTDGSVDVEWTTHPIALNVLPIRTVRAISWRVSGECSDLALQVMGQRSYACHGFRIASVTVNGAPSVPIFVRLYAPGVLSMRLCARGTITRRSLLLPPTLHNRQ